MDEAETMAKLLELTTEVEEYATQLIQEKKFNAVQVAFIFATIGASLLEIRGGSKGKDAAVAMLRRIADDVERGVKPTPMQ